MARVRVCAMRERNVRSYAVAPVQTDKTKESLVEMNKEFRGIVGDHPIDGDELTENSGQRNAELAGLARDAG